MRKRTVLPLFLAFGLVSHWAHAVEPYRSVSGLPTSNGWTTAVFDLPSSRLAQLLEFPFRYPTEGRETRDFLYDAYAGLRVGAAGSWLTATPPVSVGYVPKTGIVQVVRELHGLRVSEYHFTPTGLDERAVITILEVTRLSGTEPVDVYFLANYHLGAGSPSPDAVGEGASWSPSRSAFYEWGPSGIAMGHGSLVAPTHVAVSPAASADNPYAALLRGGNLSDATSAPAPSQDVVVGFQNALSGLSVGQTAYAGYFGVLALDADAEPHVDAVRNWARGRSPEALLRDEVAGWTSWVKSVSSIADTAFEATLAEQSQVVLRMGQVRIPGAGHGQLLASVAPGKWNISWVRDMAYATVGLTRAGHFAEARAALAFQLGASAGKYESYVGSPYLLSVVRYFGDGTEESDANENGPNVEFDGFGLFLWSLSEYVEASGDTSLLRDNEALIRTKVLDVLMKLQEPSGLIAPDSSIWEVHWNGKQRHFAYTTITAAAGLCHMARYPQVFGNDRAAAFLAAGKRARDALLSSMTTADGTIAQSTEALAAKKHWLDAAALEAINLGLVDPTKRTARATLSSVRRGLVPPSGRGLMRSDVGEWYDSQEWVFIDLRGALAMKRVGLEQEHADLLAWNVAQGVENAGLLSELHERTNAAYVGESPMVGFGAGAFLTALADRKKPLMPACGDYSSADQSVPDAGAPDASQVDGGVDADAPEGGMMANDGSSGDAVTEGGADPVRPDAAAAAEEASSSCAVGQPRRASGPLHAALAAALSLLGLGVQRRRRPR